jgi:hypothetical protein
MNSVLVDGFHDFEGYFGAAVIEDAVQNDPAAVFKPVAASNLGWLPRLVVTPESNTNIPVKGAWTYRAAWDVPRAKVFGRCEKEKRHCSGRSPD